MFAHFLSTGDRGNVLWFNLIKYIIYVQQADGHIHLPLELERGAQVTAIRTRIQEINDELNNDTPDPCRAQVLEELVSRGRALEAASLETLRSQMNQQDLKLKLKALINSPATDLQYETSIKEFAMAFGYNEAKADAARQFAIESASPNFTFPWQDLADTEGVMKAIFDLDKSLPGGVQSLETPEGHLELSKKALDMQQSKLDQFSDLQDRLTKSTDKD